MVYLAQGDLDGARAVIRSAAPEIEPTALTADFANYWDLFWVLDEEQQQLALRLPPSTWDGDRGTWGIIQAQLWHLRGRPARLSLLRGAVGLYSLQPGFRFCNVQRYVRRQQRALHR